MAFPASITVNNIRGFGPFGKTLASAFSRLSALIALGLDQVDNTPDNLKPISLPVQNALSDIDSNVTTLTNDVVTINGKITTLNDDVDALNRHAYPTLERPDPSTVPAGWMIWDTDLLMPLWTDQTNWYDATGAAR